MGERQVLEGVIIQAREHEPVDHLLRRFSRKVIRNGVLHDLKRSRFARSSGEQRRWKRELAASRRRRIAARMQRRDGVTTRGGRP